MTDTEIKRRKAICEVAGVKEIDDVSDGFHTFRQLYYQRMMLFATIVKQNKDKAWKSLRHEDGELCFGGGWFIVGIDTPEGSYTYHYEDNYFSLFDCKKLERGKHWDGHTEMDVTRLLSLPSAQPEVLVCGAGTLQSTCNQLATDCIERQAAIEEVIAWLRDRMENNKNGKPLTDRIRELPSVTSKRKIGKWILAKGSNGKDYHKCSECLHTQEITGVKNYCAVCGADMRGEQDDAVMD
jgi:hypothetical protein